MAAVALSWVDAGVSGATFPAGMDATAAARSGRTGVLIVDEEMLVRAGLRAVIEADPGFRVVADAPDLAYAVEAAMKIHPRLAIVGGHGHGLDIVEATRRIREASPGTSIVLLAPADDSADLVEGLRAGAAGVVRYNARPLELLSTLKRALSGETVVDPAVATAIVARLAASSDMGRGLPAPLTPRETEILRLVARGETNREIANRLILAVGTIKVHVEHILDKLGVSDRTQAAVRAVELGIVRGDGALLHSRPHGDDREE